MSARDILGTAGIGYVDGLGNVQLELPGLLLRLTGARRQSNPKAPTRLSGKSSLVVQAMLLQPANEWHLGDLAERSNVSAGLVHRRRGIEQSDNLRREVIGF